MRLFQNIYCESLCNEAADYIKNSTMYIKNILDSANVRSLIF